MFHTYKKSRKGIPYNIKAPLGTILAKGVKNLVVGYVELDRCDP